jgi:MFS transporter, putative metabolite transport protein
LSLIPFEEAPFQRAHWKLVSGATAGYISDGYTLGVVGIALASAHSQLALTPAWLGALGAGSLAGLFLGALASGSGADRCGRRPIYAYNMVAFVGLSVLQLWVHSAAQLLALRFLLGLVLGTDYVVCKALLAECIPRLNRGRALSLMGVAWAMGYALAYIIGFMLESTSQDAWRWILASSAIPALISLPLRLSVPESPLWLIQVGRREQAQQIIERCLGKGYALPAALSGRSITVGARPGPKWRELFSSQHRAATLVAAMLFFCLVVPYFAVSTFIPQVMAALHVSGNEVAGLIYILGLLLGSVGGFLVVDWFPRRLFVIGSFAVTSLALLVSTTVSGLPDGLVVLTFAVFSCVLSAAQAQVYVYLPELFPTSVRASGLGIAVAVSRLGAAAGTSLLPWCVQRFGVSTALYVCTATLLLGGVVAFLWAPETRHIPLDTLTRPSPTI